MKLKHTLRVMLAALLIGGPAQAQLEPVADAVSYLDGLVGDICNAGSYSLMGISVDDVIGSFTGKDVRSLLYVCDYQSVLRQAERATSGLFSDLDTAGRTMGTNLLNRTLDIIGSNRRDEAAHADVVEETNDRIAAVLENIREDSGGSASVADYQQALRHEVEQAGEQALVDFTDRLDNYKSLYAEGSAEYQMYHGLANNPLAVQAQANYMQLATNVALQAVDVEATHQASALAAQEFADIDGYQEIVARTIAPATATDDGGTAAQLESRAAAATSTRESINELSRGWADYMRQDAALTGTVIEGLKATVQQQSLTNLQLKQQADRHFEAEYDRIQAQQELMEVQLTAEMRGIEDGMRSLQTGALSAASALQPQPIEGDYCENNWCPPALRPAAAE